MSIDQLYQNATEALKAIADLRAQERAHNAKLERISVTTLRMSQPSDDVLWSFYKTLCAALPDEDGISETFQNICSDMDIDTDGNPLEDEGSGRRMSDVEFDYRHAKMGRVYL